MCCRGSVRSSEGGDVFWRGGGNSDCPGHPKKVRHGQMRIRVCNFSKLLRDCAPRALLYAEHETLAAAVKHVCGQHQKTCFYPSRAFKLGPRFVAYSIWLRVVVNPHPCLSTSLSASLPKVATRPRTPTTPPANNPDACASNPLNTRSVPSDEFQCPTLSPRLRTGGYV